MSEQADDHLTSAQRVEDLPRMLEAIRIAVREALLVHARLGNPIAIWRDGRVEIIPPERIEEELARAEAEASPQP